jgi:hypothetical protein
MSSPNQVEMKETGQDKKDEKKIDPNKMVSMGVLYRYATAFDWAMLFLGSIGSCIVGAAQPGTSLRDYVVSSWPSIIHGTWLWS